MYEINFKNYFYNVRLVYLQIDFFKLKPNQFKYS